MTKIWFQHANGMSLKCCSFCEGVHVTEKANFERAKEAGSQVLSTKKPGVYCIRVHYDD